MPAFLDRVVARAARSLGYKATPIWRVEGLPGDFEAGEREIIRFVRPYTLTTPERLQALVASIRYLVRYNIPGDVVECGVWKGGSMMAAALTLRRLGASRSIHLFDTFAGMPRPGPEDVSYSGQKATVQYERLRLSDVSSLWTNAPIGSVRAAMAKTGYDPGLMHFIEGMVEDTIPARAPTRIALLRLDTDWYSSTRHELVHLFPRLSPGGVLIVDDYGHWEGAKKAVDEYFAGVDTPVLLNRVDYSARIAVKPGV